ncbi:MAG: alpha/beta hydrolase [Ethanoligenens sp.]
MQYEVIRLREVFPVLAGQPVDVLKEMREAYSRAEGLSDGLGAYREPTLTVYCPDNSDEVDVNCVRPSVIICPGGGYSYVSFREGEPVALAFVAQGYNAFVLDYTVAPQRYPTALLELAASMAFIRKQADRFHVDPDAIAVAGFSAGGHLAACLGTLWQEPFLADMLELDVQAIRPNALILSYSVLSSDQFTHMDSFDNLLGKDAEGNQREQLSLEKRVNPNTPPTFLWHTVTDPVVPVENALLFANALRMKHIPFELHLYSEGGHGLSLCGPETAGTQKQYINPHCSTWFTLCDQWLRLVFNGTTL